MSNQEGGRQTVYQCPNPGVIARMMGNARLASPRRMHGMILHPEQVPSRDVSVALEDETAIFP